MSVNTALQLKVKIVELIIYIVKFKIEVFELKHLSTEIFE